MAVDPGEEASSAPAAAPSSSEPIGAGASRSGARLSDVELGGLIFNADFDSGNIAHVEQRSDAEAAARWREMQEANSPPRDFRASSGSPSWRSTLTQNASHRTARPPPLFTLWTRADCEGTEYATRSRSWFHFSVRGATAGRALQFEIRLSNQEKLFRHDMRPVFRSLPSQPEWRPLRTAVHFIVRPPTSADGEADEAAEGEGSPPRDAFCIQFVHKVTAPPGGTLGTASNETLYFAFCYPQSYADLMAQLAWTDALFQRPSSHISPSVAPLLLPLPPSWLRAILNWTPSWLGGAGGSSTNHADGWFGGGGVASEGRVFSGVDRCVSFLGGKESPSPVEASDDEVEQERLQLQRYHQTRLRSVAHKAALEASRSVRDCLLPAPLRAPPASSPVPAGKPTVASVAMAAMEEAEKARLPSTAAHERTAVELAHAAASSAAALLPTEAPSGVYYRRELLARSVEGRRIDLLTITGADGAATSGYIFEDSLPAPLMPEGGGRPARFPEKRYVLVTSRVHPGETPAAHVLDGLLEFLMRADDPRAIALRERFVFKLVPMLNPDGVYHGNTRADTFGCNLNRKYANPTYESHPSIFASVELARQLHSEGRLHAVIDVHAHAGKRGCFFYGNQQASPSGQADAALFMNLCALNTRWVHLSGCTFFGGGSHDGSARSAIYRLTGLPLIFTLECNYNRGPANDLQPRRHGAEIDSGRMSPEPAPLREISPKYDPAAWGDIGKAIAIALLDLAGANPASRLGPLSRRADDLRRMRGSVSTWAARMQAQPNSICPSDDEEGGEAALCEEADGEAGETGAEAATSNSCQSSSRPTTQPAASPTDVVKRSVQPVASGRSPPARGGSGRRGWSSSPRVLPRRTVS